MNLSSSPAQIQRHEISHVEPWRDLRPIYFPHDRVATTRNLIRVEQESKKNIMGQTLNPMTRRLVGHIVMDDVLPLSSISDIQKMYGVSEMYHSINSEKENVEKRLLRKGAFRASNYHSGI